MECLTKFQRPLYLLKVNPWYPKGSCMYKPCMSMQAEFGGNFDPTPLPLTFFLQKPNPIAKSVVILNTRYVAAVFIQLWQRYTNFASLIPVVSFQNTRVGSKKANVEKNQNPRIVPCKSIHFLKQPTAKNLVLCFKKLKVNFTSVSQNTKKQLEMHI